jgi:ABC-2 type transport system ATP-binding protein
MSESVIDLKNVTKQYRGRVRALQGVALTVRKGEVFGLLGPNGAGKSTLIKIMMTVVRATTAEGTILGHRVGHKPTLARVGYLPEHHRFPRYLTGRQTLEFFAALSGVDRPTRRRRSAELIETVGMTSWADKKVGAYSKGMMQRIGLAQALVNDPDLVLLDEPTDGVDPVGRKDIRDVLLRMRDAGKTVFINSHLLSELESVCERVAILVGGRVARQGTMDDLTAARQRYEIELACEAGDNAVVHAALLPLLVELSPAMPTTPVRTAKLRGGAGVGVGVEIEHGSIRVGTTDALVIQDLIDAARSAGLTIKRVQPVRPSLEDLFMEAVIDGSTGRSLPPGAAIGRPVSTPAFAFPVVVPVPVQPATVVSQP